VSPHCCADVHPTGSLVTKLQRCRPGPGNTPCKTLVYVPNVKPVQDLLRIVAADNGLSFEDDFLPLPGGSSPPYSLSHLGNTSLSSATQCVKGGCELPSLECLPCGFVLDNATLSEYLLAYPNQTQTVVMFAGAYSGSPDPLVVTTNYVLYYNATIGLFPFFENDHAVEAKRALDDASIEYASQLHRSEVVDLNLTVQQRPFPIAPPRFQGFDVVASYGGIWFYVPPMITFFVILVEIVNEKHTRLRIGMRMMGLKSSAFWASWLAYGLAFCFATTMVLTLSGWIAGFTFFTNTNFFVPVLLFTMFGGSMVCLAFLLSTVIVQTKTAQVVAYSAILCGFVFQTIICSAYGGLLDLLFDNTVPSWVRPLCCAVVCVVVLCRVARVHDAPECLHALGPLRSQPPH
jgi:hypothetical protein